MNLTTIITRKKRLNNFLYIVAIILQLSCITEQGKIEKKTSLSIQSAKKNTPTLTQVEIDSIITIEKPLILALKERFPKMLLAYYPSGIVRYISLTNNDIKTLPTEIQNLKYIKSLFVYDNKLEVLPSWIAQRDSLRNISIGGNNFKEIPEIINRLCNLEYLGLSDFPIDTLKLDCIFNNLSGINLEGSSIKHFPNIKQAEGSPAIEFSLSNTQIKSIPKEIGSMRVRRIKIRDNQLEYIAPEIGQLEDLERLYLTNSPNLPPDALPKELGNCKKLQVISFDNCNLTEFPVQITEIEALVNLSLNDNNIKEVPAEISNLQNMSTFYIKNNQLTTLPKELNKMPGLHYLGLENNKIESLPAKMFNIQRDTLCSIVLGGNPIKSMPVSKEEFGKGYKHL